MGLTSTGEFVCGTGGWSGPKPGDPDNNSILSADPAFGGIDVSWTYPTLNSHAVAHTIIYRTYTADGSVGTFDTAIRHSIVNGSYFFDRIEGDISTRYTYWIQIVSVNGTIGELIGPASAYPRSSIEETIQALIGKIDSSALTQALRSEIEKIALLDGKIIQEIQDRIAANTAMGLALEVTQGDVDQSFILLQEEASLRTEAASAIVAALQQEADTRAHDIAQEARQRLTDNTLNAQSVLEAALTLHNELTQRADDIALARLELTQNFQAGIAAEAQARLDLDAKTTADTVATRALIVDEATTRTNALTAEADQRNLLAAQIRGSYTGNDLEQVTEGMLYQERQARVSLGNSLVEQLTLLSAGQGEQFDWKSIWYFDDSVEGWTGNGTPVATSGWLRPADHGTDPHVISPTGLAVTGAKYGQVRLRIRKYGSPVFSGYLWWKNTNQGSWDEAKRIALTEPSFDGNGIGLITIQPGWAGEIAQVKLSLSVVQSTNDYFTMDWFAIGRPSPGASSAQLQELERVTVDTANTESLASKISTLDSTLNHPTTGLTATRSTLTNDYYTKANADGATASAQSLLLTEMGNRGNKVYRQATAPTQGTTQVTLADGSKQTLNNLKAGDLWLDSDDGNKPHVFDGSAWVYSADASAAATTAYLNALESALASAEGATVTAWRDAVAEVVDPATGLGALRGQITETQDIVVTAKDALVRDSRVFFSALNEDAEATLNAVIAQHQNTQNEQAALAMVRQDVTTKMEEGLLAEASARQELATKVNDNAAHVAEFYYTKTDTDSATATAQQTLIADYRNGASMVYRQPEPPVQSTYTLGLANGQQSAPIQKLREGDVWFDSNDGNKPHVWTGTEWFYSPDTSAVASQAYITNLESALATAEGAQISATRMATAKVDIPEASLNTRLVEDYSSIVGPTGAIATKVGEIAVQLGEDIDAAITEIETTRIGYCVIGGKASDHTTKGACEAAGGTWNQGIPMATAVKQVSITPASGESMTVEQAIQTVEDLGALYTLKLDNGLTSGGYGIYNDGTTVQAAFDVDTFWIGRGTGTKLPPFVLDGDTVFLSNAVVPTIQSDNYNAGVAGWKIHKSGWAEFSNIKARGDIEATSINVVSEAPTGRMEIKNNVIKVYDALGKLRVKIGDLSA